MTTPPGMPSSAAIAAGHKPGSGVAIASDAACTCGPHQACSECPPDKSARDRSLLVDALEAAAIRLRDAELAKLTAGKEYQQALDAFNRFVAPVK